MELFLSTQIDLKVLLYKKNFEKYIRFISETLNCPNKIELIFRASEHAFKANAFHTHCDNINDTLVLVRTSFGRTLGGYSHYKWNDERKDYNGYVHDSGRRSFLMQLDLQ